MTRAATLHTPWRPLSRHSLRDIPPGIASWVADPGSLTARLTRHFHSPPRVVLRHCGRAIMQREEAELLGCGRWRYAQLREVCLQLGGETRVYARSVLPYRSLRGRLYPLRLLGTRPLGGFLFRQRDLVRASVAVALVQLPAGIGASGAAWARRSLFRVGKAPILVTEVFLDAITAA